MILCSAGDFFGGGNIYNEPKDHFIAQMMAHMKYDAIAVGEMDLSHGLKKLVGDWKKYKMKLVCANLFHKMPGKDGKSWRRSKKTVFPPYLVISRGGVKIGFISVVSPRTKIKKRFSGAKTRVEALTYIIEDPEPIVKKLVPKVRKKCDILVFLAHMDKPELEKILPDLPEIDFAVIGHSDKSEQTREPFMMGSVPVYKSSFHGQSVGALRITLDPGKKIADTRNNIYNLDKTISDDENTKTLIAEFESRNRQKEKELYARQMLQGSGKGIDNRDIYKGIGNCIRCHMDEFRVYSASKHSKAYSTLSEVYKHRDSSCISCHSTGYGRKGGFAGIRMIGGRTYLVDVQCEACHGPGVEHKRNADYAGRAAGSCKNCHTKDQDPSFNYTEAWERIAH